MSPEEFDLNDIHFPPPEEGDFVDRSAMRDWDSTEPPLESMYTLPAQGLDELERDRFGFHVVNADESSGQDLWEALGKENTLLVNGKSFVPEHVIHQLDVLSKGKEPMRVVFQNLSELKHGDVFELEKFFDRSLGYPIKSMYFIDEGKEDVDAAVRGKLLMRCDQLVDSATLLDAAAFGWGARNPYSGAPVGGPDYTDGGEQTFYSPSSIEAGALPTESLDVTLELDNAALLEMSYDDREKKLIRLGLNPTARGNEVDNSAAMLFKSLRNRGVTPEEMIEPNTSTEIGAKTYTKNPGEQFYRYSAGESK